jgi:biopolymer transport protein ExbD
MVEIERQTRKSKSIPLISLIDVVFQLLIYFMLTTSFTRSESLELSMPPAAEAAKLAKQDDTQTLHIYISNNGETFLEQRSLGEHDMAQELRSLLAVNPSRGVLVMSAPQVPVKVLVRVMDRIYTAGGKNIAVADWVMPPQPPVPKPSAPSPQPEEKSDNG